MEFFIQVDPFYLVSNIIFQNAHHVYGIVKSKFVYLQSLESMPLYRTHTAQSYYLSGMHELQSKFNV